MCLAVPGKIVELGGQEALERKAMVDFGGIKKEIYLAYTPEAEMGDYILVHVGFAIKILKEDVALDIISKIQTPMDEA